MPKTGDQRRFSTSQAANCHIKCYSAINFGNSKYTSSRERCGTRISPYIQYTYARTRTNTCTHTSSPTCTHTHTRLCTHVHAHAHVHTQAHINTRAHTHSHMRTHIYNACKCAGGSKSTRMVVSTDKRM